MTYRLRATCVMVILGALSNSYAADSNRDIPNQVQSKPVQLKDLLSVGEKFINSAAHFTLTPNVGSTGNIHFLKAYLYSSTNTDCTGTLTLRGAVSVIDNNNGFPFTSGQPISFNEAAAFALFQNTGQQALTGYVPADIRCIELYLNGGNDTNNSTICTQFDEDCTAGSICNTSIGNVPLTWQPNQTPCGPNNPSTPNPSLYVPSFQAPNGLLYRCTFSGSGFLACNNETPMGGFNNAFGLAINNGYAYGVNNIGTQYISRSVVDPSTGAVGVPSTQQQLTQPFEIALSGGHYYVADTANVGYGDSTQISGAISAPGTLSGFSYAVSVAVNNNYIYIVNQTNSTVTSCPINPDGSIGPFMNCSAAYNNSPAYVNGITIHNKYAYITTIQTPGYPTGGITYCKVGNGTLTDCTITGLASAFSNPLSIAAYNGFVYFSNTLSGYIGSCQIDTSGTITDGSLYNCIPQASNLSITSPGQISIY